MHDIAGITQPCDVKAGTHEGACSRSTLLQHAPGAKLPRLHQRFLAKKYVAQQNFCSRVWSLISNWFDMREQAPGAKLLHDSVSGPSSLLCTEICFAGACFRSKLHRVYWLRYLPGSMFRERVSGVSFFVCTAWSTYPGASFGSVFQEQAPSCVPAFTISCNLVIMSSEA